MNIPLNSEVGFKRKLRHRNRSRNNKVSLYSLSIFLVISIFFIPDYIGFSVFNCQRVTLLLIWYMILRNPERTKEFKKVIFSFRGNAFILIYMVILLYTAVYRRNINTFFNPFFDQLAVLYTMIYLFKAELSVEKFLSLLIRIAYVLCIMGILEFLLKGSVFLQFEMIPGMVVGDSFRNGQYRIMGPAHHPLGYGLYLLIMTPLVCFHYKKRAISLFSHFWLFLLIAVNVYLTGSRSTLGLFLLEIFIIFLVSSRKEKLPVLLIGFYTAMTGIIIIMLFYNTSAVQSVLISIAHLVDAALNTKFAEALGVDTTTYVLSEDYRKLLPLIFKLDWINPLIGRGYGYTFNWAYQGFWISSIDNYYVNQYIKVAYPGLIIQLLLYGFFLIKAFRSALCRGSRLAAALSICFVLYFVSLWWVDVLGTLDYIFVLFALLYAMDENYILVKYKE